MTDRSSPSTWARDRRGFLTHSGVAALCSAVGSQVPFGRFLPPGLVPLALAEPAEDPLLPGKDGLTILNQRPINAETPAHLLDDDVTPASRMFVRNNGIPPPEVDVATWTLVIEGEAVKRRVEISLADLRRRFEPVTYQLQLECGGNGRSEFRPAAKGNQWTTGAVSCAEWTGARLRDVLDLAGVETSAAYVGYYGADTHLSGDAAKVVISRGVPMWKARRDETLVAWALNGEPIPPLHGAPLRMVAGGFPASASGKWLRRLVVRDRVHDGPKMTGHSYRVPCRPVRPGAEVPESEMCIIEGMPVKSLITRPKSGREQALDEVMGLRGHAWAGEQSVARVDLSIDFGRTWTPARLQPPRNRHAWQHFEGEVRFPQPGYYEVWARATDDQDRSQPMVVPGWNPRGYLNNACHRIAVQVKA
jgi:DMSO/TMAO reductase YedYZ molybdopterin-dependent catalytic subunit